MHAFKHLVGIALFAGAVLGFANVESQAANLSAEVTFHCLWWSDDQMEGFDPNSPPPQTTDVTIQKWEYSDPVGVPHPDTVDVVIKLTNTGTSPITDVVAVLNGQWRTGPLNKSGAQAAWNKPKQIHTWKGLTVDPGASIEVRTPVNLAVRMTELEKKRFWPWMFRALLTIHTVEGSKPLLNREGSLPIQPGN